MMDIGKRPLLMLNITSVFALDGSTNPNNNIHHGDSDLLSSAGKIFAWNLSPYRHVVKNKIAANYDLRNGYLKWALHGKLLIRLHHSPSPPPVAIGSFWRHCSPYWLGELNRLRIALKRDHFLAINFVLSNPSKMLVLLLTTTTHH